MKEIKLTAPGGEEEAQKQKEIDDLARDQPPRDVMAEIKATAPPPPGKHKPRPVQLMADADL